MLATVSVCEGVQKRLAEVIFPALWFTRILRIRYCDIEQISLQVRPSPISEHSAQLLIPHLIGNEFEQRPAH